MDKDSEYVSELPSEEVIEEGRRNSLYIGLAIGAGIIALGILFYLIFGSKLGA